MKVAITGFGCVTPLGADAHTTWTRLIKGDSGIKRIPFSDGDDAYPSKVGGIAPDVPEAIVKTADSRKMDRFIQLALMASLEAFECSGLDEYDGDKRRFGVCIGSGIGGLPFIEKTVRQLVDRGARGVSPFFVPACLVNLAAGHVAIRLGLRGPCHSPATACAAGSHALGDAYRMICMDKADVMVAGGAESALSPLGLLGFSALRALSKRYNDCPAKASRPFDKNRDGFVMGEGSGILVLEKEEHARARGAKIYGYIVGYGSSADAFHMTAPDENGVGAKEAMRSSLRDASLVPSDINYINAHGTSTPKGDLIELRAVESVFDECVSKNLWMSSTKSSIGHLLGASGGVEGVFTLLSLYHQNIPGTLNLEEPETTWINLPKKNQKERIQYALSNSFGFGGTNASLIFKRYD